MFFCETQEVSISSKKSFMDHIKYFHCGEEVECPVCQSYRNSNQNSLRKHLNRHSDLERNRCFGTILEIQNESIIFSPQPDVDFETEVSNNTTAPATTAPDNDNAITSADPTIQIVDKKFEQLSSNFIFLQI